MVLHHDARRRFYQHVQRRFFATVETATAIHNKPHRQRRSLLQWYSDMLDTHPVATKCITSGLIAGAGDFLCQSMLRETSAATDKDKEEQQLLRRRQSEITQYHLPPNNNTFAAASMTANPLYWWDSERTARFVLQGALLTGPGVHAWYTWLNRCVPGTATPQVLKRIVLDQFLWNPAFISVRLAFLWFLEGQLTTPQAFGQQLANLYPNLMPQTWSLWVPALFVNFKYVPLKYQLLYANVVSLVWNAIFSYVEARQGKHLQEEEEIYNGAA